MKNTTLYYYLDLPVIFVLLVSVPSWLYLLPSGIECGVFFFLLCFFLNYKWDGNECVNLKRAKKKRNTHHAWLTPTSFNRCEEWTLSLFSFFWAFCAVMKWNEERTKARAKRPKEKRKRSVNEWAVCFAFAFVQFTHLFRSACNWTKHKGKTRLTSFIPLASWGCVLCLSLFIGFVCNGVKWKHETSQWKEEKTKNTTLDWVNEIRVVVLFPF